MNNKLSAIVAIDRNGAIGKQGQLLCHMPADMRHFKETTMGHSIVMGRKTFESFPKGALPGRQNIVITRSRGYAAQGVTVAHSVDEALAAATMPGEVFVIGGEQIYRATFPLVDTIYLTVIDHKFEGVDAHFPRIDMRSWKIVDQEEHPADDRNPYPYTFMTLKRKRSISLEARG
ncbi:MAG: dihydrofolate reductase [Muribaculaceae bacterium]|nr:dihydrofolate reductase [Muribaculaceae bacterium]